MTLLDDDPAPDPAKAKDSPDDKGKPKDDQIPEWLNAAKDDNLKKDATLRRYKSLDEQLLGHVKLKSKLGENPVSLPGKDDPPEKVIEFYENNFGVPKDPAGYKESLRFPENHPASELDDKFFITAKKLNFTPGQVQGLYDWLGAASVEAEAAQAELTKQTNEDNMAELTKKYGHDLKKNEQVADLVLTKLFPAGAAEKLKKAGLHRDPVIFGGLVQVGQEFMEGDVKGLKGGEPLGGKKSKAELEELNKDPRYGKDERYTAMVRAEWEKTYPVKQE